LLNPNSQEGEGAGARRGTRYGTIKMARRKSPVRSIGARRRIETEAGERAGGSAGRGSGMSEML
jgi:hypothetical protein